jgi:ribose transport system substrate-binding protein
MILMILIAACGNETPIPDQHDEQQKTGTEIEPTDKPYVIGYSVFYMVPSWQRQALKEVELRVNEWKAKDVEIKLEIANANGDGSTQVDQIDNMISQGFDAILVNSGSDTSLNRAIEKAEAAGISVIAWNALPTTELITSKISPSQYEYGKLWASWMVDTIGTEGKIILHCGPAGIAVVEEANKGVMEVLDQYPGIESPTLPDAQYLIPRWYSDPSWIALCEKYNYAGWKK